jgi:hypothetical protein
MRIWIGTALALAMCTCSALAQSSTGKKPDPTAELLGKLRKPVDWTKVDGVSLNDLVAQIGEKFAVTVLVNEPSFKGIDPPMSPTAKSMKVPQARGMSLMTALPHLLGQMDATFLVRKDYLEIVPLAFAAQETKNVAASDDDSPIKMAQPLVSMIFKEKPLNEAVAELAEEYNLTAIVTPQSGDARTGFVTARLLNAPADKALEMLAIQCDLRIVQRANIFLVTTREHADGLFQEKMDRERSKIELDKFRSAPPAPPQQQQQQVQLQVLPITPIQVPNPNPAPKP